MTVLVTGAAGFLGRSVSRTLIRGGDRVIALSRSSCSVEGVQPCSVDLTDPHAVARAAEKLQHVSRIVHLASPVPGVTTGRTFLVDAERIFVGFIGLVAALPAVVHVTYLSSIAVYGTAFTSPPTEDSPLPEPSSAYALHKKLAEERLRHLAGELGWTLAVLRSTQIYGPGEPHGLGFTRMLNAGVRGERITMDNGGEDERDLMYVDDVAAAVAKATVDTRSGVFNLSSGQGIRMGTLATTLHELLGGRFEIDVRPITRERTRFVYDNRRMREVLGVAPATSIRDGVRACVEWELA